MTTSAPPRPRLGPIIPDQLYPLTALCERVGLGKTAMRSLRRQGLKVKYVLGRAFVLGADFISLIDEVGKDTK
jgi:hypothetical protein